MLKGVFKNKKIRRILLLVVLVVIGIILYFQFFHSVTISPVAEARQMEQLELTKQTHDLDSFSSDGCSGNVSSLWSEAVNLLSGQFPKFSDRYEEAQQIPFEDACVAHDRTYHKGEGGYVSRLEADNKLRKEIIDYAINNSEEIKSRTGISTDEEVIFMYEFIAGTVYRGVRLGGAPCTGMPYAWGFGYNNGRCVKYK